MKTVKGLFRSFGMTLLACLGACSAPASPPTEVAPQAAADAPSTSGTLREGTPTDGIPTDISDKNTPGQMTPGKNVKFDPFNWLYSKNHRYALGVPKSKASTSIQLAVVEIESCTEGYITYDPGSIKVLQEFTGSELELILNSNGQVYCLHGHCSPTTFGDAGGSDAKLLMQDDGNAVLYNKGGTVVWASGPSGQGSGGTTPPPNCGKTETPAGYKAGDPCGTGFTCGDQLNCAPDGTCQ